MQAGRLQTDQHRTERDLGIAGASRQLVLRMPQERR